MGKLRKGGTRKVRIPPDEWMERERSGALFPAAAVLVAAGAAGFALAVLDVGQGMALRAEGGSVEHGAFRRFSGGNFRQDRILLVGRRSNDAGRQHAYRGVRTLPGQADAGDGEYVPQAVAVAFREVPRQNFGMQQLSHPIIFV